LHVLAVQAFPSSQDWSFASTVTVVIAAGNVQPRPEKVTV
jgi:hypothetical protein